MLIKHINKEIELEEKNVEVSIFDKKRGILLKKEYSYFQPIFIDLNPMVFYKVNQYCWYNNYNSDFKVENAHVYLTEDTLDKAVRDYINSKNEELNRPYANAKIQKQIDEKLAEIEELKKEIK